MKSLSLFCFALLAMISLACTKDHVVIPDPETPSETLKLQTKVLGKWLVELTGGRTTSSNAFMEFMSDSTYIIYNITETVGVGHYEAVSEESLKLEGFGTISAIQFDQTKISCVLSVPNKDISITGIREAEVMLDERTKLFARSWALTNLEDGGPLLTSDEDPNIKFDMDFVFSANGTYLNVLKYKGEVSPGVTGNWKWHSTLSDRVVWWRDGEAIDENQNLLIRELTPNFLKLTAKADNELDVLLTFKR
jgi:hypothetical protein